MKKQSRRTFVESAIKSAVALPLVLSGLYSCESQPKEDSEEASSENKKLSILILGGTSFLGPHQIAYALERGHSISTFTRGKTKPTVHAELFDQVEQLIGDRQDNLTALHDRKWDVVIDNSGRDVEWTKATAQLLKDNCDLYVYTSSTGVYYPYVDSDFIESSTVLMEEPEGLTDEDEKIEYWYGVMKAQSEQEAIKAFGAENTIVVRPTYMIGPADKTDRFIHWPIRLSKGGETMVPGKAGDAIQYADVRDVAEWMIRLIEERNTGTFNAVGPKEQQDIRAFMEEAQGAFEVASSFVHIDDYDFLMENDIYYLVPWIMPTGNNAGSAKISNKKAKANGFTLRPLTKTIQDTHQWWNSDAITQEKRDEVEQNPESVLQREAAIIAAWKAR
ncbi:MAG: NAD-dependent epimerase/dehydratase family protein [Bacteroidota bacterium]